MSDRALLGKVPVNVGCSVEQEDPLADHLRLRLALRRIPEGLPRRVHKRAKELFYDRMTGNLVAVARARYSGRTRDVMVAFLEKDDEVLLITVHPLKPQQKANRIASGRWVAYAR